jgi:transposase
LRVGGSRKRIHNAEFREGADRDGERETDPGGGRGSRRASGDAAQLGLAVGWLREGEWAELERLRAEAREKDKRVRELESERAVCKRFVALWVK